MRQKNEIPGYSAAQHIPKRFLSVYEVRACSPFRKQRARCQISGEKWNKSSGNFCKTPKALKSPVSGGRESERDSEGERRKYASLQNRLPVLLLQRERSPFFVRSALENELKTTFVSNLLLVRAARTQGNHVGRSLLGPAARQII